MAEVNSQLLSRIETATTACRNASPEIAQHANLLRQVAVTEVEHGGNVENVRIALDYLKQSNA